MLRNQILLSLCDSSGLGLEIGPGFNPLLPKARGFNVQTVDYASRAELVEKYKGTSNVDVNAIEEVDWVTRGRPLLEIIPYRHYYDYIVASHVVEHVPDLVSFIEACAQLMKPEGVLVLAVPDKRYCFDLFQPLSSTGSILQAFVERRERPQPSAVFDSVAYDVLRDHKIGWPATADSPLTFNSTLEAGKSEFERAMSSNEYIDVHVWRFVPSSFRLIVNDLNSIGVITLRERTFVPGEGNEFYISLSQNGTGSGVARDELATCAMREAQDIRLPPRRPLGAQAAQAKGGAVRSFLGNIQKNLFLRAGKED